MRIPFSGDKSLKIGAGFHGAHKIIIEAHAADGGSLRYLASQG